MELSTFVMSWSDPELIIQHQYPVVNTLQPVGSPLPDTEEAIILQVMPVYVRLCFFVLVLMPISVTART